MPSLSDHFHFNNVALVRISDADLDPTIALINQAYAYQDEAKGEPRINASKLQHRLTQGEFYVAKQAGEIVGCICVELHDDTVLHFGLLTVSQPLRGTGLGAALIAAAEAYGRKLSCQTLELDYMSLAPWLKHYYEHYGFTATGEIIPWGSINLIRMTKVL